MYPYPVLFGMTLYELMIVLGFLFAVITYRFHADRANYPAALQNVTMLGGTFGIGIGYYAAVLVQAFYNYMESGKFELSSSTGATFLGGLMGGVAVFFAIYFGIGSLAFKGKEKLNLTRITDNCNIVITCVVIAHAMGRLGCLFAGCCHGAIVDGFPGIYNYQVNALTVPIPLFEALFLLALYGVMTLGLVKGWGYQLPIYLGSYGTWRFFIEYFRTDDRGQTVIPFLSPSQLVSLIMIGLSVLLFFLQKRTYQRRTVKINEFEAKEEQNLGENSVESGDNPA